MSRNYQMRDLPREEADRFDAYDRAQMAREAMAREAEKSRLMRETAQIDAIDRPLSSCEIADIRSKGFDV